MNIVVILFVASILYVLYKKVAASNRVSGSSTNPFQKMNIPAESHAAFIGCTFSMLGKLAEADGLVTEDERNRVIKYIDTQLNLQGKYRKLAIETFNKAASSPLLLRDYAEHFSKTYRDRVTLQDKTIEILLELSLADGTIDEEEEEQIKSAALLLDLTQSGYERIKRNVLER